MYADESGVEQITDKTRYFIISGVIIHEKNLQDMKREVYRIRNAIFPDRYKNFEIHLHDIYKGKKDFFKITPSEIQETLYKLYTSLIKIPFTTISIIIDKKELLLSPYMNYDVLETAYTFLIERFDKFLCKAKEKGMVRLDRTSSKPNTRNAKDQKILDLINKIRQNGTNWQSIENIVEEPLFFDSDKKSGLQIADAIVYCTNNHIKRNSDFERYWNLISDKVQKDSNGNIQGYGLYRFPKI